MAACSMKSWIWLAAIAGCLPVSQCRQAEDSALRPGDVEARLLLSWDARSALPKTDHGGYSVCEENSHSVLTLMQRHAESKRGLPRWTLLRNSSRPLSQQAQASHRLWCEKAPVWVAMGSGCPTPFLSKLRDAGLKHVTRVDAGGENQLPVTIPSQWESLTHEHRSTFVLVIEEVHIAETTLWALAFVATLLILASLACCWKSWTHVVWDRNITEEELASARGRPIWTYLCVLLTMLASLLAFAVTVVFIQAENQRIREHSGKLEGVQPVFGNSGKGATSLEITNAGARGYEAGLALAASAFFGAIIVLMWRASRQVKVTTSLLSQFALRGATASTFLASMLEMGAGMLLRLLGLPDTPAGVTLHALAFTAVVGYVEEACKLYVVLLGASLKPAATFSRRSVMCFSANCCRVLLESQLAMLLAGLAVGFGFMIVENTGYIISVATMPPREPGEGQSGLTTSQLTTLAVVTLITRIVFNIHPYLTAYSAANYAKVAFEEEWNQADGCQLCVFTQAVMPSAVLHACFDAILVLLPLWGIVAVPLLWWISRALLRWKWESIPDATHR